MSDFDIGNVYSKETFQDSKTYYIAIKHQTLITYKDGKFGRFTTKKRKHVLENSISVGKLCKLWEIKTAEFDDYMSQHFSPDEDALNRARKEKD